MPIADFEQFCHGVCEIAGVKAPLLQPDPHGALSFSVDLGGLAVTAIEVPRRPGVAYVMVELGAVPEATALQAWRALLGANRSRPGRHAPVFSRDKDTGGVVLQCAFALCEVDASALRERITDLVDMGCRWRQGHFLTGEPFTSSAPLGATFA